MCKEIIIRQTENESSILMSSGNGYAKIPLMKK